MLYISLHNINRFHVDFTPCITFTPLAYMILSILPLYASSSPVHYPVNKLSLAFQTLVLLDYSLFVSNVCVMIAGDQIHS